MNNYLAKSLDSKNLQTLESHSKAVATVSRYVAEKILNLSQGLCHKAYLTGLLHDIGKATEDTQKFFHMGSSEDFDGALHHEVSWAILKSFQVTHKGVLINDYPVLEAIYWHHSQVHTRGTQGEYEIARKDSLEILREESLPKDMKDFLEGSLEITVDDSNFMKDHVPLMNNLNNNNKYTLPLSLSEATILRTCLIAADRYVSSDEGNHFLTDLANSVIPKEVEEHFSTRQYTPQVYAKPAKFDMARWDVQQQCLRDTYKAWSDGKPIVVHNAPAGFGKTTVGVQVALNLGQQVIWVCPRNTVVESVARSIREELATLGVTRSIEVILASKRKFNEDDPQNPLSDEDMRTSNPPLFTADIVVTNLDNLLKASVDNQWASNLYRVLSATVVFDEYHEFPECGGLFNMFVHIMQIRAIHTKAKTLLLSATPHSVPPQLWDPSMPREASQSSLTVYLPGRFEHFPAAHKNPYTIGCVKEPPLTLKEGEIIKTNAISTAQNYFIEGVATHLAHSNFYDKDKRDLFKYLFAQYGKGGLRKGSVSSAPIIQASLNISFVGGYIHPSSGENDMQLLGRIDRFGDVPGGAQVMFINPTAKKDPADLGALRTRNLIGKDSPFNLNNKWEEFLKKEFGSAPVVLTLDELYLKYNAFARSLVVLSNEIFTFMTYTLTKGTDSVAKIFPRKTQDGGKGGKGKRVCNKGTMRSPNGTFYAIIRNSQGDFSKDPEHILTIEERDMNDILSGGDFSNKSLRRTIQEIKDTYPEWASEWIGKKVDKKNDGGRIPEKLLKLIVSRKETPFPCSNSFTYDIEVDPAKRGEGLLGLGLLKK